MPNGQQCPLPLEDEQEVSTSLPISPFGHTSLNRWHSWPWRCTVPAGGQARGGSGIRATTCVSRGLLSIPGHTLTPSLHPACRLTPSPVCREPPTMRPTELAINCRRENTVTKRSLCSQGKGAVLLLGPDGSPLPGAVCRTLVTLFQDARAGSWAAAH